MVFSQPVRLKQFFFSSKSRYPIVQLTIVAMLALLVATNIIPLALWDAFMDYSFLLIWGKALLSGKNLSFADIKDRLIDFVTDFCGGVLGQ